MGFHGDLPSGKRLHNDGNSQVIGVFHGNEVHHCTQNVGVNGVQGANKIMIKQETLVLYGLPIHDCGNCEGLVIHVQHSKCFFMCKPAFK